ncbi:MAG: type II toxin-antitoxin system PrlF family antitoxin [Dehalococcoidia bacterium]|nr:type II toxin-antitoxin system PrlF family antitoxin [Dehalococcoidia bacterium]
MPRSTLTSKGQITLPKIVREALHLDIGDRVAFELRPDGAALMRPETGDLLALFGCLKPAKGRPVTLEAMRQAIRRGGTRA